MCLFGLFDGFRSFPPFCSNVSLEPVRAKDRGRRHQQAHLKHG